MYLFGELCFLWIAPSSHNGPSRPSPSMVSVTPIHGIQNPVEGVLDAAGFPDTGSNVNTPGNELPGVFPGTACIFRALPFEYNKLTACHNNERYYRHRSPSLPSLHSRLCTSKLPPSTAQQRPRAGIALASAQERPVPAVQSASETTGSLLISAQENAVSVLHNATQTAHGVRTCSRPHSRKPRLYFTVHRTPPVVCSRARGRLLGLPPGECGRNTIGCRGAPVL